MHAVLLLLLLQWRRCTMEDPDLYAQMQKHSDARAGAWPADVVGGLAAVTERCIAYHAGARGRARDCARCAGGAGRAGWSGRCALIIVGH